MTFVILVFWKKGRRAGMTLDQKTTLRHVILPPG